MIRGREKFLTRLYMTFDFIFIQIAFFLAWVIRFRIVNDVDASSVLPFKEYFLWNLSYSLIYLVIAFFVRLYVSKRKAKFATEMFKISQAHVFSMFVLLSLLFTVKIMDVSRMFLAIYIISAIFLSVMYRFMIKQTLRQLRRKGYNRQFVLVLGAGTVGKKYVENLMNHPEYGLDVLGFLDDYRTEEADCNYSKFKIIGKVNQLHNVLEEKIVDEVVIALPLTAFSKYQHIIATCEKAGIRVTIVPDFFDVLPANPHFEQFGDLPIINIRDIPLDEQVNRFGKRIFDIVFSLTVLILTSPLMLAIAIGIKISSPGPVFFKQERVGLNRRTFMMYKFRSMKMMDESASDTQWTVENDPRRTKFGTFLRKTSLDEFPQFYNVLIGDMSIVGPRPERPYFVDQFKEDIPKYMIKHQVRPGITGWAQVCGLRGDTSIEERIKHDIYYIENWTQLFDIKIILKTVINGFVNKNAY